MNSFKLFLENTNSWKLEIEKIIENLGQVLNEEEISETEALKIIEQISQFLPEFREIGDGRGLIKYLNEVLHALMLQVRTSELANAIHEIQSKIIKLVGI